MGGNMQMNMNMQGGQVQGKNKRRRQQVRRAGDSSEEDEGVEGEGDFVYETTGYIPRERRGRRT